LTVIRPGINSIQQITRAVIEEVIIARHVIEQNPVTFHKIAQKTPHKVAPETTHFQVLAIKIGHHRIIIGAAVRGVVSVEGEIIHVVVDVAAVVEDDRGYKNGKRNGECNEI